jgi:hypothetical protein
MAIRKRFPILAAATAAIIGVALYLPGSASFVNGFPVGSGYGGNNCPVGLSMNASPTTIVFGQSLILSGQLVAGPSPSVPVGSQLISIDRINGGTSTVLHTTTVLTNSAGTFGKGESPKYTAFHTDTWTDPHSLCESLSSGDNAWVRSRTAIGSTKPTATTGGTLFTIYGGVRPNKHGKTVNLKFFVAGSSSFTVFPVTLDAHSNFSQTFLTHRHGVVFEFRGVYRAQDALNLGSATPYILVHIS